MKTVFCLIAVVLLVSACSLKAPERAPAYSPAELAMIGDCRSWVTGQERNKADQMNKIPVDQIAFVMMHETTMKMVTSTFGKSEDICRPGDDYYKAYAAYANAQKEISVAAIKETGATARAGAYVYGAVKISDNFGNKDSSTTNTTTTTTTETTGFAE